MTITAFLLRLKWSNIAKFINFSNGANANAQALTVRIRNNYNSDSAIVSDFLIKKNSSLIK
jgi:hypothetical protein